MMYAQFSGTHLVIFNIKILLALTKEIFQVFLCCFTCFWCKIPLKISTPSHKQLIPGSERPFLETHFFLHFSVRLSGNECSRVISMGKFGPTASNLRYDFWCQNAPHRHTAPCTLHRDRGLCTNNEIVTRWNPYLNWGHSIQNREANLWIWDMPKIGPAGAKIAPKMAKNGSK